MDDAEQERAAIVAWLRDEDRRWLRTAARYRKNGNPGPYIGLPNAHTLALKIEALAHHKDTDNG